MFRTIFFYENEGLTFTSILRIFLLVIVLFFILAFPITTFGNLSNFIIGIIYSLEFFAIFLIWTPYFNEKEKKHSNVIFSVIERIGISTSLLIPLLGIILVFFFIRDKRTEAIKELKKLHEQKLRKKKDEGKRKKQEEKKREERYVNCRIKINSTKKYIEDDCQIKDSKLKNEKQALELKNIPYIKNIFKRFENTKNYEIRKLLNEANEKLNLISYNEAIKLLLKAKDIFIEEEIKKEKHKQKREEKIREKQEQKEKFERRIKLIEKIIEEFKKHVKEAESNKALNILKEAEEKFNQGKYDETEKLLDKAKNVSYQEFVEKQKKKGFVEYNGKWNTPEQVKTWKEIDVGLSNNFANLTHFEFEQFIGVLFQKMGYQTTVTRKTVDYGVDVIAKKGDDVIAIQVKKNSIGNNVGDIVVQNTLGGMWKYKANKAIIITTSDFTTMAHEQARGAPIELWNKRTLHQMVRKYFVEQD